MSLEMGEVLVLGALSPASSSFLWYETQLKRKNKKKKNVVHFPDLCHRKKSTAESITQNIHPTEYICSSCLIACCYVYFGDTCVPITGIWSDKISQKLFWFLQKCGKTNLAIAKVEVVLCRQSFHPYTCGQHN